MLAIDINDDSPTNQEDEQPVLSIESLKMRLTRNQIEHRSIALVEEDTLRSNMLILLKLARNTIIHAFMLIHSCSVSDIEGKATTIGTTFYQAILNIVKENIHKDLIT